MAQGIVSFVTKPDHLSFIPGTHIVERKKLLSKLS